MQNIRKCPNFGKSASTLDNNQHLEFKLNKTPKISHLKKIVHRTVRRELKFGFGLHQQTKQKTTSMKLRREEDDGETKTPEKCQSSRDKGETFSETDLAQL